MDGLGHRRTTHFVSGTRMSMCTRFQMKRSYIFCLSCGTSESSDTLGAPRTPMYASTPFM